MNLLFLTTRSPYLSTGFGGAETSIRLLAESLAKRQHGVVYVTRRSPSALLGSHEVVRDHGVRELAIGNYRGHRRLPLIKRLSDARLTRRLKHAVARHGLQVAYAFYEIDNLFALLEVRQTLGLPKVALRMAGMRWYDQCTRNPRLIATYERAFNDVDAVNFLHEGLRQMVEDKIAELGMDVHFGHAFTCDIGSSVDPLPQPRSNHRVNARLTVMMAARFSDYAKRQDLLIEAAALLDPTMPIEVQFYGDGPLLAPLQERARELGVQHRVAFHSFIPQEELWRRMREADLLCHACDHEGLGKTILESMALGLPVLASDVPPINQYVVDGVNGFLVRNDPQAWARRIEELASDTDARTAAARAGLEFARREHDPAKNVLRYEAEFHALLGLGS